MWTWAQPSVAPTSSPFCELIRFPPAGSECHSFLNLSEFKKFKMEEI